MSGNPSQYDDLQAFITEQALLRRLAGESQLPVLELDISNSDVPAAMDKIAGWPETTDGIYPDY